MGINYVRPPVLKFTVKSDTDDYTEYEIMTYKEAKYTSETHNDSDKAFINDIDSLIYCNDTITIQQPKKDFMKRDGKHRFAYAFGMFPNPKDGQAAYLDGCILGALGLKRQKTGAHVICFITPDISIEDKEKLEVVFDRVIYVPYISPYKMAGSGDYMVDDDGKIVPVSNDEFEKGEGRVIGSTVRLKNGNKVIILRKTPEGDLDTIMMDKNIFKNCKDYNKSHPYSHVFFKLHIFNPKLFPYEKVCFVDSDLVPMNYYDSLFMLNTPAGWIEYRKKFPFQKSFHWDRCDYLEHGKTIPSIFTDVGTKGSSDVNAGLMVISPDKEEYDDMIRQLKSPTEEWLGPGKEHIGFYDMDLSGKSITGRKFVDSSYCYPEQNYLTKRYSGKWTYIEYSFQSWSLDPCNSFGIHMAAFNPKPWFKQPANSEIKSKKHPFHYFDKDIFVSDVPKAVVLDDENVILENISISYELFNDLIIWGLVDYPGLVPFFVENTKIYGTKLSFGEDIFKPLSDKHKFKMLKLITKKDSDYKKLSISQQYISNLLNDYKNFKPKVKNKYLSICNTKLKDRYGEYNFDPKIITYPGHTNKSSHDKHQLKNRMVWMGGRSEVAKAYQEARGQTLSESELDEAMAEMDLNGDGKVQYHEFDIWWKKTGKMYARTKKHETAKRLMTKRKRRTKRNSKRRSKRKSNHRGKELLYFKMDGCNWCNEFEEKLLPKLKQKMRTRTINGPKNRSGPAKYGIKTYPALVKISGQNHKLFKGKRTLANIMKFMK